MPSTYQHSPYKRKARITNAELYKDKTGRTSIPKDRGYWTLCNHQPIGDSEIDQLADIGLFTKPQFHGIDRDSEIIIQNRLWHPDANWHYGDWLEVIQSYDDFNPALIYLDTTSFADHYAASNMAIKTMLLCPPDTMLLVNLMLNNPRSKKIFDDNVLIGNIARQVPSMELEQWELSVENYEYNASGKTTMITYVLYKS